MGAPRTASACLISPPLPSPVAKVRHEKPVTRRQLKVARRRFYLRQYSEEVTYATAWPKSRGPAKSPNQKAWIEHFVKWSYYSKQPDPCAVATAETLAPETGYWPRDILHSAGSGKMIDHDPNGDMDSPLPFLFKHPPSLKYEGKPRVITPTTSVRQVANFNNSPGGFRRVIPTDMSWDNNAFWNPTTNPERITFLAKGVYLVMAEMLGYSGGGIDVYLELRLGETEVISSAHGTGNGNFSAVATILMAWPFEAGQYVTLWCANLPNGNHYRLKRWQIVAITPEGVI